MFYLVVFQPKTTGSRALSAGLAPAGKESVMDVTSPHASKDGHVSHPDNVPKVLLKARNVEPWHGPWEKELSGSRSSGSTKYFGIFAVLLWTVSITKCWLFPGIIDFKNVEEMITRITLLKKKHWSLSVYYVTFCTVIVE